MAVDVLQHGIGEMKSGSRSSHTAFYLRVNRLIGSLVALLGGTVEIRRNRQLAHGLENLGKGDLRVVPVEVDPIVGSTTLRHHRGSLRA